MSKLFTAVEDSDILFLKFGMRWKSFCRLDLHLITSCTTPKICFSELFGVGLRGPKLGGTHVRRVVDSCIQR